MRGFSNLEIERGIVDQNHAVGMAAEKLVASGLHIAEDFTQMLEHFAEAHKSHLAVMDYRRHAGSGAHAVAA